MVSPLDMWDYTGSINLVDMVWLSIAIHTVKYLNTISQTVVLTVKKSLPKPQEGSLLPTVRFYSIMQNHVDEA